MRPSTPFTLISKRGLVRLLMRSDKPIAMPFQDWALDVVIEVMETGERKAQPGETIPVPGMPISAFDFTAPVGGEEIIRKVWVVPLDGAP